MRMVRHCSTSALVAFVLGSLLLVQVLASAQPKLRLSAPARSEDRIDSRGAIDWLGFRAAPVAVVDEDLALASRGCEQTTEAEATRALGERAQLCGAGAGAGAGAGIGGKRTLELMLQNRKLAAAAMHERSSSPAVTSAAPTVFGVSIYLIIAWLALLYLMFRTGSISSTSDATNYAEEIRG